jgi:type IV secretion system protein VirB10
MPLSLVSFSLVDSPVTPEEGRKILERDNYVCQYCGLDGRASEELDRKEGTVRSEGNKAGDAQTIGETAAAGASVGALAGSISGAPGMGAGIGAAAGAAAGLVGVMFSRGPDAVLAKGTTIEMVLDRTVTFDENDLDFSHAPPRAAGAGDGPGPLPGKKAQAGSTRHWPL